MQHARYHIPHPSHIHPTSTCHTPHPHHHLATHPIRMHDDTKLLHHPPRTLTLQRTRVALYIPCHVMDTTSEGGVQREISVAGWGGGVRVQDHERH